MQKRAEDFGVISRTALHGTMKMQNGRKNEEKNEEELGNVEMQEDIQIDLAKIKKQISRIPNWKTPGPGGVGGYCIKNSSSVHSRTENQLNRCFQENRVKKNFALHKRS